MGKIKRGIIQLCYALFRLLPIRNRNVLLFSYYGEQYSGSPKYIGEYLKGKKDYQIIWAFTDQKKHTAFFGKSVHYSGILYYYYLATSAFLITNYRMTSDFKKRKGQKYIQTWHSSLRLKMIEKDAADTLPSNYQKMALEDSKQIDVLLAGSQKSREIFERSFWYQGEILNAGTPQCDILLENSEQFRDKVHNHFSIPKNAYIALYAPTFRKDHNTDVYNLDMEEVRNALKERFGGDWYILLRLHPHLIGKLDCFRYTEHILQATDYDDVQELLCAADFLISDYSAIMFDYVLRKQPCILYTPDLESYTLKDRKLYFRLEDLPFEHVQTQEELSKRIADFSEQEYSNKVTEFLTRIGSFDDGHSCERVYNWMKEH